MAERITWQTLLGLAITGLLIVALAYPIAIWLGPPHQALVARLAAALVTAVVVIRFLRSMREAAGLDAASPEEQAQARAPSPGGPDPLRLWLGQELHGWRRASRPGPVLAGLLRRRGLDHVAPATLDELVTRLERHDDGR